MDLSDKPNLPAAGKALFDSAAFTRRLESLYGAMLERQHAGLPPGHLPAAG